MRLQVHVGNSFCSVAMHVQIKGVCTLRGGGVWGVYVAHMFQRVKVLFQRHLRKQRLRIELEPAGVTRRAGVIACRKVRVGMWVASTIWGGGSLNTHLRGGSPAVRIYAQMCPCGSYWNHFSLILGAM